VNYAGRALAYSPDGTLLATGARRGSTADQILVLDARSGETRVQIPVTGAPYALAFDGSGERLACGSASGNLLVWDLATNRSVRQFTTGSVIGSIAFVDGDRKLVTQNDDSALVYDLQTGEVEHRARLDGGIQRVVVDGQRSRLVVARTNGAISSLSLPGLAPAHGLESAHHGAVSCLALSSDGRLLATGGEDHRVVLRDPMTFAALLYFPDWTRTLRTMAFDCASRRLAVVGTDSDLEVWDLAALSDGLANVGLHWDRHTAEAVSTAGASGGRPWPTSEVVIVRPGNAGGDEKGQSQE
jgi:WD40 repeat protein